MSEPFGLFQILQSFLSQSPQNGQTPPPPETEQATQNSAENTSESQPTSERTGEQNADGATAERCQNAAVSFMQAHENRAKRIKKP